VRTDVFETTFGSSPEQPRAPRGSFPNIWSSVNRAERHAPLDTAHPVCEDDEYQIDTTDDAEGLRLFVRVAPKQPVRPKEAESIDSVAALVANIDPSMQAALLSQLLYERATPKVPIERVAAPVPVRPFTPVTPLYVAADVPQAPARTVDPRDIFDAEPIPRQPPPRAVHRPEDLRMPRVASATPWPAAKNFIGHNNVRAPRQEPEIAPQTEVLAASWRTTGKHEAVADGRHENRRWIWQTAVVVLIVIFLVIRAYYLLSPDLTTP